MKIAFAILMTVALFGQTLTLSTNDQVVPGATINVTATLAGSAGKDIQAIGVTMPSGATNPTAGSASVAASKTLRVQGLTLLLLGLTSAPPVVPTIMPYGDGPILSYSFVVPPTSVIGSLFSLSVSSPEAVDSNGTSIPLSITRMDATVGITTTCLTTMQTNISSYLAAHSLAGMATLAKQVRAAATTGTCQ